MKLNKAFILLLAGSLPTLGLSQVVVLGAPASAGGAQAGFGNTNFQPVLPQGLDQHHFFEERPATVDQRGIGIAPQASEPTIGQQFNQPMIGQQGPPPAQADLPQQAQVLPPGVQAGLSDQGVIFPAPGTIIVGPQGDTAVVTPQGGAIGVGQRGNVTAIGPQGQATAIGPNNIAPSITPNSVNPALSPQSTAGAGQFRTATPALSPTGRGPGGAPGAGSGGSAAAGK